MAVISCVVIHVNFISPPKEIKVHKEPPVTHMGYTGNTREK